MSTENLITLCCVFKLKWQTADFNELQQVRRRDGLEPSLLILVLIVQLWFFSTQIDPTNKAARKARTRFLRDKQVGVSCAISVMNGSHQPAQR